MNIPDTHEYVESLIRSTVMRFALPVLFLAGTLFFVSSVVGIYRASAMLRIATQPSEIDDFVTSSVTTPAAVNRQSAEGAVFLSELPEVAPTDSQFRFAAKIAQEQDVRIVQMQSEPLKSNSSSLGQTRLTVQVRGDYRGIKNLWIAVLAKYSGLTLERLVLTHRAEAPVPTPQPAAASALGPADRGDDQATIEMIQYTRPLAVTR